jgi:myo-inositol 2-dehydrogenase/D-chiro-inositol 1-dehydrogenase
LEGGVARKVSVGVIGAGRIGRIHAGNLARHVPDVLLRWIADPDLEAARAVAEQCGVRAATDEAETLLADPDTDAVVVASPTGTHAPLVEREKPLDLDLARAAAAMTACRQAGVLLMVGFNRRFDPGFRRLADGVRAGEIGPVELVRITSRDPQPPPPAYLRTSGGMFLDMSIHDFDMARYLARDEVVLVHALGAALVDPEIAAAGDVDTAIVALRFAGGALGCIDNSRRAAYGYDQRAEVLGPMGTLVAGNTSPTATERWDAGGRTADRPHFFFLERYAAAYRAELQAFVECVRDGRTPPVTGWDGVQALRIALAAGQSLREGRPVRVEVEP